MKILKNLHEDSINCVQTKNQFIFSCSDTEFNVIDTCGANKKSILKNAQELSALKLSNLNDKCLLTNSKHVYVYDLNTFEQINRYKFCKDTINCLDLSPDESLLASCDDAGEVKIFDLRIKEKDCLKLKQSYRKHENICSCVKFNPLNTLHLASGSFDCNLIKWDLRFSNITQSCLSVVNMNECLNKQQENEFVSTMTPSFIHSIEFYKEYLLVGIESGSCLVIDCEEMQYLSHKQLHNFNCALVKVTHFKEDLLASAGNDGKVTFFQIENNAINVKHDLTINNHLKINFIEINDHKLYVCDTSNDLKIYELK